LGGDSIWVGSLVVVCQLVLGAAGGVPPQVIGPSAGRWGAGLCGACLVLSDVGRADHNRHLRRREAGSSLRRAHKKTHQCGGLLYWAVRVGYLGSYRIPTGFVIPLPSQTRVCPGYSFASSIISLAIGIAWLAGSPASHKAFTTSL
jgi:hypothetical protein